MSVWSLSIASSQYFIIVIFVVAIIVILTIIRVILVTCGVTHSPTYLKLLRSAWITYRSPHIKSIDARSNCLLHSDLLCSYALLIAAQMLLPDLEPRQRLALSVCWSVCHCNRTKDHCIGGRHSCHPLTIRIFRIVDVLPSSNGGLRGTRVGAEELSLVHGTKPVHHRKPPIIIIDFCVSKSGLF